MLGIFLVMVAFALTYPAETRVIPLVIGIPGIVISAIQIAVELRTKNSTGDTEHDRKAELRMFGWFVSFVAGIILFGFIYAGPVMVALYLHFSWREKWYITLGSAPFAWVVLHGIFERILGLSLFDGLAVQWLSG
jgi:hypothetical protein